MFQDLPNLTATPADEPDAHAPRSSGRPAAGGQLPVEAHEEPHLVEGRRQFSVENVHRQPPHPDVERTSTV